MNIIIPILIILIIIFFSILIINRKLYFTEDFTGSYDQNTIEDLIPMVYIPSNPFLKEELTEYEIIDVYKKILDRSPNVEELKLKVFQTKDELTEELYNSYEYEKLTKVQDNLAEGGIESSIAKRNLLKKIIDLYKKKYKKDPNDKILMPLRDCYIHLRNNPFLFKAFLEGDNFINFENEVLTTITITKKNLLEIFNKYYNLLELKLKAEEIIKNSKGGIDDTKEGIDVETLKKELSKITQEPTKIPPPPPSNVADINEIKNYVNPNIKENFQDEGDLSSTIKRYIDNAIASNPNMKFLLNSKEEKNEEQIPLEKTNEIRRITNELPENSEVYVRVYNPIEYKQSSYVGDARFKPPICTSLGQKSLEQPIYINKEGTEIDKAFDDTQVGSIMPKFIYKEYQDIRIR